MFSLDVLPADILLLILPSLSLQDAISLSMVNQSFYTLSQEHSFWLEPLRTTRNIQPIPCATMDDLTVRSTSDLKQLALRSVRLARNWSQPLPQTTGPTNTFSCGVHNNILFCLPGTDAIVLYSLQEGSIICANVKTGESSAPVSVNRILDMSSPLEEPTSFSVSLLADDDGDMSIVVLKALIHPVVTLETVFTHELSDGYIYAGIFMTPSVVGVARAMEIGTIEVQSFNLLNPKLSTVIVTDRPNSPVLGSTVIGDTVFFIIPQAGDAFVYACPPRLLAYSEPSPETDYTIQRSHVAHIPRPRDGPLSSSDPSPPSIMRLEYCVLSTEPNRGRNTISVARNITTAAPTGRQFPHSLEITFWPRPAPVPASSRFRGFKEGRERERADGRRMQPAQTICIPGSLSNQPGTAWELLVIANSGLAVVLVIDPPDPAAESPVDSQGPPLRPVPKLMMARYDPVLHSVSLHELRISAGTGQGADPDDPELQLDTRGICALGLDDHRGYVIVVTVHNVVHYIPYA